MCDLKTAFFRFRRWAGKVLRPQTDAKTVFRYERAISRECRPRLFPERKGEKFSPEIYPAVAFRKPFVFRYTFGRVKRPTLTAEKPCFRSGNKNAPFADTTPLLFVLYILDQIGRLAVQEGADYFKRSPRRHLPASYLLEHRFSHNLFFADASRVVACLFQSGQHVNFIYDWHLRKSPPFPLSLL